MNAQVEPRAYGAGVAGSSFNIVTFIKKPKVICEILALIFAIVVFGCIAQEGYWKDRCRYNGSNACGYGVAIGVIAFLLSLAFILIDIFLKNVSSASVRRIIVLSELVLSCIWTFMWFVGFCFLADQWRVEPTKDIRGWGGRDSVQAAIAFSFFSTIVWGVLTFFTFRDFREGVTTAFSDNPTFNQTYGVSTMGTDNNAAGFPHSYGGSPPTNFHDSYPAPPFTATQPPIPPVADPTHYYNGSPYYNSSSN